MRDIINDTDGGAAFYAALANPVTHFATCLRIERVDGTVYAFTDHDQSITYDLSGTGADTQTYLPANLAASSDVYQTSAMSVNNFNLQGFVSSDGIAAEDLIVGLFDQAEMKFFLVDWSDHSLGVMPLHYGWIGEVIVHDEFKFQAEFRSLEQALQTNITRIYQTTCDAKLGDAQCDVDLDGTITPTEGVATKVTLAGTVTAVTSRQVFDATIPDGTTSSAVDGWFNFGLVTWQSGDNEDVTRDVYAQTYSDSTYSFTLSRAMERDITVGDTFSVYAGCNHSKAHCKTKFDNYHRFPQHPFIPGPDVVNRGVQTDTPVSAYAGKLGEML